MKNNIRAFFIWKALFLGTLIAISTELLSIFNSINYSSIRNIWILVFLIFTIATLYLIKKKKININLSKKISYLPRFEIIFIFLIFFLTFLNSLIYPPNTLDTMTYHLSKVMHWIQNSNLAFYPTNDLRQLILAPFAEFALLHLYLLIDGDYFSNLVQWYSMIISCLTISLISKELGCNDKFQIFTTLFCVTLPMGILQSSSTQTDYVTTMWLSIMVYFILKYINLGLLKYLFAFSIALGLGILTKGTFYIFAFPFCVWIGLHLIKKNRKHFIYLFTIPLIVLSLNFGHFSRNINLYGNPLGINSETDWMMNESKNLNSMTSNLFRNMGLNLAVPNKNINDFTAEKITKLLGHLNISTNDPKNTKVPSRGYYIPFSFYESTAPNTLHFIIIFLTIFFIFLKKKLPESKKYYFYSTIAGFILFSLLLKWTAQHNRYLLCFFVLFAPIVSFSLIKFKLNKLMPILALCLSLYSIPYLLFNKSRPLLGNIKIENGNINFYKPFFLYEERDQLYFIADRFYNDRDLFDHYSKIAKKIKSSNCYKIGFDNIHLEYPLWSFLKKNKDSNNLNFKIFNIDVKNKSASITNKEQKNEKKCSIVGLDKDMKFIQSN